MGVVLFSMKMAAASAVVLSSAVAICVATPPVTKFLATEAPSLYGSVSSWLTPPYLYFVVNGIIISIAATSRFQMPITASDNLGLDPTLSPPPPPPTISAYGPPGTAENNSNVPDDGNPPPDLSLPEISTDEVMDSPVAATSIDPEDGIMTLRSSLSPKRRGSSEDLPAESTVTSTGKATMKKPPLSARHSRGRSIKTSPEASKPVVRAMKYETLESTWRTITEGSHVPLGRHTKKFDTWEMHTESTTADPGPVILKSETFDARCITTAGLPSASPPSMVKLRRDPSLGQDDLNHRVEAFIKKFNAEMRLQRQNSPQQYMGMINCSN